MLAVIYSGYYINVILGGVLIVDLPLGALVLIIILSILLSILLVYVLCINTNSLGLDAFVLGFGLFCMVGALYFELHWGVLLCFLVSLLAIWGHALWFYLFNMHIVQQAYLSGKKLTGKVVSRELIYGRSYYGVESEDYLFRVRAGRVNLSIDDTVSLWHYGIFTFLDGDSLVFSGDGFVLMGCRLLAALTWLIGGFSVSWLCFIPAIGILIWQLYATDLCLVLKHGDEHTGQIKSISTIRGRVYLDLDTGKRVRPVLSMMELYPIGAKISCIGSYADVRSIKL